MSTHAGAHPPDAVDRFAAAQGDERRAAVRLGSKAGHEKRTEILFRDYADPDELRRLAGAIKQHALDHLDVYLPRAEANLRAHGAKVHFAGDAAEARAQVLAILRGRGALSVVKAKSMVTEEIELGPFLAHPLRSNRSRPTSASSSCSSTTTIRRTSSNRSSTRTGARSRTAWSATAWARTTTRPR